MVVGPFPRSDTLSINFSDLEAELATHVGSRRLTRIPIESCKVTWSIHPVILAACSTDGPHLEEASEKNSSGSGRHSANALRDFLYWLMTAGASGAEVHACFVNL
jgi:hypothetical protein